MFENKVIWITGASSGIGEELAKQLSMMNCQLVLSARREAELERVKSLCIKSSGIAEDNIFVLPLDISDIDALPNKTQRVIDRFDHVDFLFNNAGISQRSLCTDTEIDVYQRLFQTDVMGQIALTKSVLPFMEHQQSGHIVITSSVAGKIGVKYRTGYCAAKHAVMGFFDALRAEVFNKGIQVTTITPGFIKTNVSKNALTSDGSAFARDDDDIANGMDVKKCVQVILKKMQDGKPEIAVGEGKEMWALWLKRFFPSLVFKLVQSR